MSPVNNAVSGAESVRAARALLKWFNSCGLHQHGAVLRRSPR